MDAAPDVATDVAFASLVELGRRGTGQHITPRRIDLARPDPKSEAHRGYFGCAVHYGASSDALVRKAADLDRPFPGHNPELLEMLIPALSSALKELEAEGSFREQVKAVVKRCLPSGRPDLCDVARDLGMSERTLQRRISEEGTSFRDLLVEARQELG